MRLFSFRMKDGNCVIIYAKNERSAVEILNQMGVQSSVAGVREITRFVANFALTDAGDLRTTLLDSRTLNELMPDYPLLQAARAQSYADFGSASGDNKSEPVLFDDRTRRHASDWKQRDKDLIGYAVQQERERFSN
ncbi:MAG: hypothetical protein DMG62_12125 [Acidobacteria bacterium]|nr:MAG: hypothetical protein DMG63_15065 [Acidobacteriota bacterium]PYY22753.1 MAG: hypothetical protein DMG62_12125 [Acidobacteriota bacterium]